MEMIKCCVYDIYESFTLIFQHQQRQISHFFIALYYRFIQHAKDFPNLFLGMQHQCGINFLFLDKHNYYIQLCVVFH